MAIDGYLENGRVVVPNFGTFLEPQTNRLCYTPQELPERIYTSTLAKNQKYIDGITNFLILELIKRKTFNPVAEMVPVTNKFTEKGDINYDTEKATLLASSFGGPWWSYILEDDSGVIAKAFVASKWNGNDIVLDYLNGQNSTSKDMLFYGIEQDLKSDNKVIRLCHDLDYNKWGQFGVNHGLRLMERNGVRSFANLQYYDFIKILDPGFDVRLLDEKQ